MARDSSPFAQRLKALAIRAGLPVEDSAASAPAAPPAPTPLRPDPEPTPVPPPAPEATKSDDDEQPTGEFPAVAEQPAPTVESQATDQPAPGFEPQAQPLPVPEPAAPAWQPAPQWPADVVAPPLDESPTISAPAWVEPPTFEPTAPTLPPPDLSDRPQPAAPVPPLDEAGAEPQSRTSALHDAPSLPQDDTPTIDAAAVASTSEPANSGEPPAAPDSTPAAAPAPDGAPKAGLTGRLAGLRKLARPGSSAATEGAALATTPPAEPAPDAEPTPPSAPVPAVAVADGPLPAKPTFAERASLRRRARTLRARRDNGLLELGAILLDQRRFGDPTSGALVRRRTDELGDLDMEITEIELTLDDAHPTRAVEALGTVRCLSCSSLLGSLDRFCAHCGTPHPGPEDHGLAASSHAS